MFLWSNTSARSKDRNSSSRYRAKLKAKNRRRVNRMARKAMGRRISKR